MQAVRKRVFKALVSLTSSSPQPTAKIAAPWSVIQTRAAKIHGSDVRAGHVIERNGRYYEVLNVQHTTQGRGGATIQAEVRDIDSGVKIPQRFRTVEPVEKIVVEQKHVSFLYQDGDTVVLMEPKTFEQVEVSSQIFGKAAVYLKEDIPVILHIYEEKVMSATIPTKVTCKIVDAQDLIKGATATPQYKKAVLDNGLTVSVPQFIKAGDEIVVSTLDDTYVTRAK